MRLLATHCQIIRAGQSNPGHVGLPDGWLAVSCREPSRRGGLSLAAPQMQENEVAMGRLAGDAAIKAAIRILIKPPGNWQSRTAPGKGVVGWCCSFRPPRPENKRQRLCARRAGKAIHQSRAVIETKRPTIGHRQATTTPNVVPHNSRFPTSCLPRAPVRSRQERGKCIMSCRDLLGNSPPEATARAHLLTSTAWCEI